MRKGKYRLVTKGDFDGVACGVLLRSLGLTHKAVFVHPKDVESGKFPITGTDITAGLPFRETAHLAFGHYTPAARRHNLIADHRAPSTARVIYNHYGRHKFFSAHEDILHAVDKGFSARITTEEILYPSGWVLLSYLLDRRSGLEEYRKFRIPYDELLNKLIDEAGLRSVWEILDMPDVEERLDLYFSCVESCKGQILRRSSVHSNLVVTDLRGEERLHPGNKFMTYALFPECDVSLHITPAPEGGGAVFSAGKSVLDRGCSLDIGAVMRRYGGGGHAGAGACRAGAEEADGVRDSLVADLSYGLLKNLLHGYFNYY